MHVQECAWPGGCDEDQAGRAMATQLPYRLRPSCPIRCRPACATGSADVSSHALAAHSAATAQPSAFVEQQPIVLATEVAGAQDPAPGEAQHPQPPKLPRPETGATEASA